eukprot:Plantae.Rhodophyta-Hildenbrandia_rubra.ctg12988.p1 GENE.Plantae.Rhodophyta-Hildenbrandia_rubra.ctg12988~~Plantae.Rhodophyta-Hildenbrandia_rubra.ctg12988.p1  ORF type:complete len:630 (-),score=99.75 Plantae.Rhodophyta-Hildenbrandia_rubra.ctg12988:187-2076(-)
MPRPAQELSQNGPLQTPPPTSTPLRAHILYGTETGTAEEVSRYLEQRFLSLNIPVGTISAMDDYPIDNLVQDGLRGDIFIFIAATTGDGVAPSSMNNFWRTLRLKSLKAGMLKGLQFAVFGLGDRAYGDAFNACARRLYRRLKVLGGEEVVELGLGDEGSVGGYESAWGPWLHKLLCFLMPGYSGVEGDWGVMEVKPAFKVEGKEGLEENGSMGGKWDDLLDKKCINEAYYLSMIKSNKVITNPEELDSPREVRHIVLDVSNAPQASHLLNYRPGDVAHVLPQNDPKTIATFFVLTGLSPQTVITSLSDSTTLNLATPCSLTQFVAANLDLTSTPRRRFLEQLSLYTTSDLEREKLRHLSSSEGLSERYQYLIREQRSLLGVLRDFPNARPPPDILVSIIPRLRPRSFSIASSSKAHPGEIHICAAMVRREVKVGRRTKIREGVCSRFWQRCEVGDAVPVRVGKGSLRFYVQKPAICIGPGTGVAPMRAFLEEVNFERSSKNENLGKSETMRVLFFGARRAKGDYLYKREWKKFVENGSLNSIVTAFSREMREPKVHVQERMEENSKLVWLVVTAGGCIYVAGSAGAMPRGVKEMLAKIIERKGGLESKQAVEQVSRLQRENRLQIECW